MKGTLIALLQLVIVLIGGTRSKKHLQKSPLKKRVSTQKRINNSTTKHRKPSKLPLANTSSNESE